MIQTGADPQSGGFLEGNAAPLSVGVTGATGFVGSAVCRSLAARGQRIRRLTRRAVPACDGMETSVVGELGPHMDWTLALQGLDVVVHSAAHVHQMGAAADQSVQRYQDINVSGTEQLALSAHRAGVRRLVFVSSIKALGERTLPGQAFAHDSPPRPEDAYGQSKRDAERVLKRVAAETGLEVVVIRPPLVYGPGVGANFAALLRWVAKGRPLPLGCVDNARSLVGLDNLVDLIAQCTEQTAAVGHTFHVSDGNDLSTPNLVRHMAQALAVTPQLWPVPTPLLRLAGALTGRTAQIQRLTDSLQVDIRHTCHTLNWRPPVSVHTGLCATAKALAP